MFEYKYKKNILIAERMDKHEQEGSDAGYDDAKESDMEKPEEPKDFSIKTKKLKQIPPPLNLMTKPDPVNNLKDISANVTSPKSPLLQKNLPFRKRFVYYLTTLWLDVRVGLMA
jgi:hypothetical protein